MKFKNRIFSLIDFSPSHNQFLFRAMKDENHEKNIDILFEGVSYIQLPLVLKIFNLIIGSNEEKRIKLKEITFDNKSEALDNLYIIESHSKRYFIIAEKASYLENDFEGTESSMPIKVEKPFTQEDILNLIAEAEEKGAESFMEKYNKTDWVEIT